MKVPRNLFEQGRVWRINNMLKNTFSLKIPKEIWDPPFKKKRDPHSLIISPPPTTPFLSYCKTIKHLILIALIYCHNHLCDGQVEVCQGYRHVFIHSHLVIVMVYIPMGKIALGMIMSSQSPDDSDNSTSMWLPSQNAWALGCCYQACY